MSGLVPGAISANLTPVTGAQNVSGVTGSDAVQRATALMNSNPGLPMPQRIASDTQNFLQNIAQPIQSIITPPAPVMPQPVTQAQTPARFGSALTAPATRTVPTPAIGGSALTRPTPQTTASPARFGSALTAPQTTRSNSDIYSLHHMLADVQAARRYFESPRGNYTYTQRSLGQMYPGLSGEYTNVPGGLYRRIPGF